MRPWRYGSLIFDRDGVEYEVNVSDDVIYIRGGFASEYIEYHWPERVFHPWMWGKPIGVIVEESVDRAHRKHLRASAKARDLEELRRQLASREARKHEEGQ